MESEYPLVIVHWEDHTSSCHWMTKEEYINSDTCVAVTIGWKVFEDDRKVIIHSSYVENGTSLFTVSGNESVIVKDAIIEEYQLDFVDS